MTISASKAKTALTCWKKAFNLYHRNISGQRAVQLVTGKAFHDGVAIGLSKRDWTLAKSTALELFEKARDTISLLPGEEQIYVEEGKLLEAMLESYETAYKDEDYQIIQPECLFQVDLPGSHHNCVWEHWIDIGGVEHWGPPSPEVILAGGVSGTCGLKSCKCYQPHRLIGVVDAVISWKNHVWVLEHKTSSMVGEMFWAQWRLDIQPTCYVYGIWRQLQVRPVGFIVDMIHRPSKNQVASYNSRRKDHSQDKSQADYVAYSREAFLRSSEDLLRLESQLISVCNEWEQRIIDGSFIMSNVQGICTLYNRICDYHHLCIGHDQECDIEAMPVRQVNERLVKLEEAVE